MIAFLERRHARAHIHHHARTLMAEHAGEEPFGVCAGEGVIIRVANAGGFDFDQHFARLRAFEIEFDDFQRLFGGKSDGGAGLHGHKSFSSNRAG